MQRGDTPYKTLGDEIARLRKISNETVAEVAGAVEIDIDSLEKIERGELRPSEDILLLLSTHFDMQEEQTTKLWELAGYEDGKLPPVQGGFDESSLRSQPVVILPVDARIIYTDMVNVVVNDFGVIMNFMQSTGQNGQTLPAARVGMSIEHAKSVIEVLQKTIEQASQPKILRSLPAPKSTKRPKDDQN